MIAADRVVPPLKYGGSERMVGWLAKSLVKQGHRVSLIAPPGSRLDGANLIPLVPGSDPRALIPLGADLLHDHGVTGPVDDLPYLTTFHGNMFQPGWGFHPNTVFLTADHARRHGARTFVHYGIPPSPEPDLTSSRSGLAFLAMAAWKVKNVRGAIRIARRAGRRLEVMGGHRINLRMGVRITLDPRVSFHGMVDDSAKQRVLSRTEGLLFPVLWPEPFGLAIVEALLQGCPVLATPWGSLPELVPPDVGFLSDSESELAEAAASLGSYSRRRCRDWVLEKFSVERMTSSYLELYQRVAAGESLHPQGPVVPPDRAVYRMTE